MNSKPISYLQTDPRWASIPYAVKDETSTIGGSGCGPTAMAMVLATWCDKSVTPKTECAWSLAHGGKAFKQGTYYGYFPRAAQRYGLRCYQVNAASLYGNGSSSYHETAKRAIDNGHLVIACMGPGLWTRSGHFVLVWNIIGNTVFINDPASSKPERTCANYVAFKRQVKYYFVVERPKNNGKVVEDLTEAEARKIADEQIQKQIANIVEIVLKRVPAPVVYKNLADVPEWGLEAVKKRLRFIQDGDGDGINVTEAMVRDWVISDRAESYGMD